MTFPDEMGPNQTGGEDSLTETTLQSYITNSQEPTVVLQDYQRIWDCADLRLARAYWHHKGANAFLASEVPYGATSSGRLSEDAVRLLLANLVARNDLSEAAGTLWFLELGSGSGLFAKLFLDFLKDSAPSLYERSQYLVSDGSAAMLQGIKTLAVLEAHAEHVHYVQLDASSDWLQDKALGEQGRPGPSGFHGVFANYLLDSLPFTILAQKGEQIWEMHLRTAIDPRAELSAYTDLSLEAIHDVLEDPAASIPRSLSELYRGLQVDARYVEVERDELPCPDAIPATAGEETRLFLHCHGAIACLRQAVKAVSGDGFVLFSDYGFDQEEQADRLHEFQHFGGSIACGLNILQVSQALGGHDGASVVVPDGDPETLYTRLITRSPPRDLCDAFKLLYGREVWEAMTRPLNEARELVRSRSFEAARWKFDEAHALQPNNWLLLEEIAAVLVYQERDFDAGIALITRALELNHLSPQLWNLLGDCLYEKDDKPRAEEAYRRAIELNPREVQGRMNLVYVLLGRQDYEQAIVVLGEALAYDDDCEYRDQLLARQDEALTGIAVMRRDELVRSINRFRGHRRLPQGD